MKYVFHIGPMKTATTYIQEILRRNRAALEETAFVYSYEKRYSQLRRSGQAVFQHGKREKIDLFKEELVRLKSECDASSRNLAIISDENLFCRTVYSENGDMFKWSIEGIHEINEVFGSESTSFVLYSRDFSSWSKSAYNQEVKRVRCTSSFDEWVSECPFSSLQDGIRGICERFPGQVVVGNMHSGFVGKELFDHAGVAREIVNFPSGMKNKSLSESALSFMRQVNESDLKDADVLKVSDIVVKNPELFL